MDIDDLIFCSECDKDYILNEDSEEWEESPCCGAELRGYYIYQDDVIEERYECPHG